jgi:hypothetical protein
MEGINGNIGVAIIEVALLVMIGIIIFKVIYLRSFNF